MKLTTDPIVQKPEEVISLSLYQLNPKEIYLKAETDKGKSCYLGVFCLTKQEKIEFYPFNDLPEAIKQYFELTSDGRIAHSYEGDSHQ